MHVANQWQSRVVLSEVMGEVMDEVMDEVMGNLSFLR